MSPQQMPPLLPSGEVVFAVSPAHRDRGSATLLARPRYEWGRQRRRRRRLDSARNGNEPPYLEDPFLPTGSPTVTSAPSPVLFPSSSPSWLATVPPTMTTTPVPSVSWAPTSFPSEAPVVSSPSPPPPSPGSGGGEGGRSNPTIDGTLTILVLLTIIFCFVWSPSIIRRCDPRTADRRRRRAAAIAAAREAEEAAVRAIMDGTADDDDIRGGRLPHGMSLDDRRDFVSNVLVTKKVVTEEEKDLSRKSSGSPLPQQPLPFHRVKSDLVLSPSGSDASASTEQRLSAEVTSDGEDDAYSEETCAICLSKYEVGDEICWSHNAHCHHAFHRECILEWLIRHEECPCCRHNYLSLDDEGEGGEEEPDLEGNNNGDTSLSHAVAGPSVPAPQPAGEQEHLPARSGVETVLNGVSLRRRLARLRFRDSRSNGSASTDVSAELTSGAVARAHAQPNVDEASAENPDGSSGLNHLMTLTDPPPESASGAAASSPVPTNES